MLGFPITRCRLRLFGSLLLESPDLLLVLLERRRLRRQGLIEHRVVYRSIWTHLIFIKQNTVTFSTQSKVYGMVSWILSSSSSSLSRSCLADKSFPWASASSELEKALEGIVRLPLLMLSSTLAGCYKWAGNPPGCRSAGWCACLAYWRDGFPDIFSPMVIKSSHDDVG